MGCKFICVEPITKNWLYYNNVFRCATTFYFWRSFRTAPYNYAIYGAWCVVNEQ